MNVLLVGGGAREHALAWRISQSRALTRLWAAPGNYGTASLAENIAAGADVPSITAAARQIAADLVVVGPEAPLADGLADALDAIGIPVFGPTRAAARLESSKSFARQLMQESGAPGPEFAVFHDQSAALDYLRRNPGPRVVKADGLAAGKGVFVCDDAAQAAAAVRDCMSARLFGAAGDTIVLEQRLQGREVSVFAFCDGQRLSPLTAACDYKRLQDADRGPNTGGMGSYSPPEFWTPQLAAQVERTIMRPVINEMAQRGASYRGVLYAGLMLTAAGPQVLEFNCRMGDPETQTLMPRLASDPLELMLACSRGALNPDTVYWNDHCCVGVVMASGGYPGDYETGFEITGLDDGGECGNDAAQVFAAPVFIGGAAAAPSGRPVTAGGRVLTVVGCGDTIAQARQRAYNRLSGISFAGAQWRSDIALNLSESSQ